MRICAILICLMPLSAIAEAWAPLDGDEIAAALTDRDVVYENARQRFYASGRTLYTAGQDSWGYWAARGDQYCSQWPPGDAWDCYDMLAKPGLIRFTAQDGSTTDGAYAQ